MTKKTSSRTQGFLAPGKRLSLPSLFRREASTAGACTADNLSKSLTLHALPPLEHIPSLLVLPGAIAIWTVDRANISANATGSSSLRRLRALRRFLFFAESKEVKSRALIPSVCCGVVGHRNGTSAHCSLRFARQP
eukprot:CAMPEP_0184311260 /NCGR_PEP_ID=MMETSP1049-20130417/39740_1 /TAXON_ID=77928 /ORGANISM="Proteomonas sulcata, Strain CCMP704" /LENGTH=135 /DNA_ID=CAMNT_0026626447 /DNA_START=31 /DNA_END=438 /DNA_ORIENTATION=-